METTNDIETKRNPALALSPYSAKPNIMLAPATTGSAGRQRALLNQVEKATTETEQGNQDKTEVEDGKKNLAWFLRYTIIKDLEINHILSNFLITIINYMLKWSP